MKKQIETGAMALPTTRLALRRYSWGLIIRAVVCVIALNVLDASLFRLELSEPFPTIIALLIVFLALAIVGAIFSYVRFLLMRLALRQADWQVVSGCCRAVYIGPVPVGQVAVVDFGGDESLAVDYAGPLRFSRKLPGEIMPANVLVARWYKLRVYSRLDGSSPAFGVRVRPKLLRSIFLHVVPHT